MGIFKLFTGLLKPGKFLRLLGIILVLLVVGFGLYRWLGPKSLYATSTTLSIIFGETETSKDGITWTAGKNNMTLKEGEWVRTKANSYALITFFDGSTVEIEPASKVKIEETSSVGGTTKVTLWQELGKTWTRVEKLADPASQYQINTPSGVAVVRGSLIEITVERVIVDGREETKAIIRAFKGAVKVVNKGVEVLVTPGKQTVVEADKPPTTPTSIPPPASKLNISITSTSPAWLQVIDPLGRSAGIVPPGIAINQIPRSVSGGALDKEQFVEISEPAGGQYKLVFYAQKEGILQVTLEGLSQGQTVFTESRNKALDQDKVYRLLLQLTVDEAKKTITQGTVATEFENLPSGQIAGTVVRQEEARKKLELPVADFMADPIQAVTEEAIQFSDISAGAPISWLWDFGDPNSGTNNTSTEQNPSHTYVTLGTYTVSLTITNPVGNNTLSKPGYVSVADSLDANFAAAAIKGPAPLTVDFVDRSTGRPSAWEWDFGDGASSTEQNPSHTYVASGYYTVKLTVTYPSKGEYTDIKANFIKVE